MGLSPLQGGLQPATHVPLVQVPAVVPKPHAVPLTRLLVSHLPVEPLQDDCWHSPGFGQASGVPALQKPVPSQVSAPLQALPSEQLKPRGSGPMVQPVWGLHAPPAHGLRSVSGQATAAASWPLVQARKLSPVHWPTLQAAQRPAVQPSGQLVLTNWPLTHCCWVVPLMQLVALPVQLLHWVEPALQPWAQN